MLGDPPPNPVALTQIGVGLYNTGAKRHEIAHEPGSEAAAYCSPARAITRASKRIVVYDPATISAASPEKAVGGGKCISMKLNKRLLQSLPKVLLHEHLDGVVRPQTLI